MNPNFDDEIKRRLEDSDWDQNITKRVILEHRKRTIGSLRQVFAIITFLALSVTFFTIGVNHESELAFDESTFDLIPSFTPIDGLDLE